MFEIGKTGGRLRLDDEIRTLLLRVWLCWCSCERLFHGGILLVFCVIGRILVVLFVVCLHATFVVVKCCF